MEKAHGEQGKEDKIEKLIKESFGVDDETLLHDFLRAQIEVKDSQIPPEPENGFQMLLEKIESRGLKACEEDRYEDTAACEERKSRRRLKPVLKVALAAAVIAVMMMAMGISAGARRSYSYTVREKSDAENNLVLNNVEALPMDEVLNTVYQEIQEKTGINVLKLAYIPSGMEYIKSEIEGTCAIIYFDYKGNRLKVIQQIRDTGTSTNIISDRRRENSIYNPWLRENIAIERAEIENGVLEYSSQIVKGNTYYQISGMIDGKEFEKIIRDVYFEN